MDRSIPAIVTSDDKNIIITTNDSAAIHVLNLETETFIHNKTEIVCAMPGFYDWLRIGDALKDELLFIFAIVIYIINNYYYYYY